LVCSHPDCKSIIKATNINSYQGKLYCTIHYKEIYKMIHVSVNEKETKNEKNLENNIKKSETTEELNKEMTEN
jgi:hypothetical protein